MVALGDKGGGALFFVAIFAGFCGFVLFHLLAAAREHEHYLGLGVDEQQQYAADKVAEMRADLENTIWRNAKQVNRFWISAKKRRRLQEEIDRAAALLQHFDEMEQRHKAEPVNASAPRS